MGIGTARAAAAYGRWEAARRRAASSATPAGLPLAPASARSKMTTALGFHVLSPQIVPRPALDLSVSEL